MAPQLSPVCHWSIQTERARASATRGKHSGKLHTAGLSSFPKPYLSLELRQRAGRGRGFLVSKICTASNSEIGRVTPSLFSARAWLGLSSLVPKLAPPIDQLPIPYFYARPQSRTPTPSLGPRKGEGETAATAKVQLGLASMKAGKSGESRRNFLRP